MCGRYVIQERAGQIAAAFQADETALALTEMPARYNVAPTQEVPVVITQTNGGKRVLDAFRWGLIPSWAKDASIGSKMINARAETVAEKPSFRSAFQRRRCLVPASGFYEWDKVGQVGPIKQPYYFSLANGSPMGFAGLWETWRPSRDDEPIYTCTIITTAANATVGAIHERMPVILSDDALGIWLDPTVTDGALLRQLLQPYPDSRMQTFAVSKRVNAVVNNDSGLIEPVVNSA